MATQPSWTIQNHINICILFPSTPNEYLSSISTRVELVVWVVGSVYVSMAIPVLRRPFFAKYSNIYTSILVIVGSLVVTTTYIWTAEQQTHPHPVSCENIE